jgi:hypothetical protein
MVSIERNSFLGQSFISIFMGFHLCLLIGQCLLFHTYTLFKDKCLKISMKLITSSGLHSELINKISQVEMNLKKINLQIHNIFQG